MVSVCKPISSLLACPCIMYKYIHLCIFQFIVLESYHKSLNLGVSDSKLHLFHRDVVCYVTDFELQVFQARIAANDLSFFSDLQNIGL